MCVSWSIINLHFASKETFENVSLLSKCSLNVKERNVLSMKAGGEISNVYWPIDETCLAFYFPEVGFSEPRRSIIPGENYSLATPFVPMAVCWLAQEPSEVFNQLSAIFSHDDSDVSLFHTFKSLPHNNVMYANIDMWLIAFHVFRWINILNRLTALK